MKFIKVTISGGIAEGKNVNDELRKELNDFVLNEYGTDRVFAFGVPHDSFDISTVDDEGRPEIVRFHASTYYGVAFKHS